MQPGKSRQAVSANIAELIRSGRPRDQAVAIAYHHAGLSDDEAGAMTMDLGTADVHQPGPVGAGNRPNASAADVARRMLQPPARADLTDGVPPAHRLAGDVVDQLRDDYPDDALAWVRDAEWAGPHVVPVDDVDFAGERTRRAYKEPAKVAEFADHIRAGKMKPVVLVDRPGAGKLMIVDGHHRSMAYRHMGRPILAYVGRVNATTGPWDEMHASQRGAPSIEASHAAARGDRRFLMATVSTKKRNALPARQFALPDQRKYPIHDAAHVRNAAARLEQQKASMPAADYNRARAAIARAAARFGIHSELSTSPPARPRRVHVRADLADGGVLHVRHMADLGGVVALDGVPVAMTDASVTPVWIELAKPGVFRGHPSGPFELSEQTFREILRNFDRTQNRSIPVDFEHASEAEPTDGTIPVGGAPAQGWIKALKVENGRLHGLVEWGPRAREMIRAGQYKFFSPAIRFNTKDRVTGEPAGAKMTSGALTNIPFLDGLRPLAAKDGGSLVQAAWDGDVIELKGRLAHNPGEYMPAIKAALKLPELATAAECGDHLARLRGHLDAADGDHDATPQGVRLGDYLRPLREFVGAAPGATWDQILDLVQDLIDAAVDEHEIRYHGAPPDGAAEMTTMTDDEQDAIIAALTGKDDPAMTTALETKIAELTTQNADHKTALKETGDKLSTVEVRLRDAETENAKVTLKLGEETARADAAQAELVTLRAWRTDREDKDLTARVDEAFADYKDKKGLTEKSKARMLIVLKADAPGFEEEYPRIPREQRHLMRNLTDVRPAGAPPNQITESGAGPGAGTPINLADAAMALSQQKGIPLDQAQRIIYAKFGGHLSQKDRDDRAAANSARQVRR